MSISASQPPVPAAMGCTVTCGGETGGVRLSGEGLQVSLPLPLLRGPQTHLLAHGIPEEVHGVSLVRNGNTVAGALAFPADRDLRAAVHDAYLRLLRAAGDLPLWRVWNCVPHINACPGGVENYRAFNAGRHDALREHFGTALQPHLPAASAVGSTADQAVICFLAGEAPIEHFENLHQVPACEYPDCYGNPPPAFARGTVVRHGGSIRQFLSGTASIRGHASVGGTLPDQFRIMTENIRHMLQRMEVARGSTAAWRVFLRHETDLAEAEALFAEAFPDLPGEVQWVRADICRADLLVEIEANFSRPA